MTTRSTRTQPSNSGASPRKVLSWWWSAAHALEDVSGNDTDPPHVDAKKAYASMVGNDNVLLTSDYAAGSGSDPLTIEVGDGVCGQVNPPPGRGGESAKKLALGLGLAAAAVAGAVAAGRVRRGDKRTHPATSRSHDRVSPFVEMTSREEFIADIGARGFVPAGDDAWRARSGYPTRRDMSARSSTRSGCRKTSRSPAQKSAR